MLQGMTLANAGKRSNNSQKEKRKSQVGIQSQNFVTQL